MDFSMIIGELKCMKAKWCSYTAIFHHLKQCLNNLVSKTKTQEGIKKKKKNCNKTIFILVGCINIYYLVKYLIWQDFHFMVFKCEPWSIINKVGAFNDWHYRLMLNVEIKRDILAIYILTRHMYLSSQKLNRITFNNLYFGEELTYVCT